MFLPEVRERIAGLVAKVSAGTQPLSILPSRGEEKSVTSFETVTTDWYARNGYANI